MGDFEQQTVQRLRDLDRRLAALERLAAAPVVAGTWTPAFTGTGTAGVFTYTNQVGRYALFGNMLYYWAHVVISAIGTPPTGNMTITGLPYACENVSNLQFSTTLGFISHIVFSAGALALTGRISPNTSTILLHEVFTGAASAQYPAANFTDAAANIGLSGFYRTR